MNNEKLKLCPFCGGEAVMHKVGTVYTVECLDCGGSLFKNTKAEAIAAWNKRTNPDAANFSYSKKSNNSELGNYPEKQDNPNELMDFVKFCRNASANDIRQIHDRARDLIAKSKDRRVCVKQNGEKAEK